MAAGRKNAPALAEIDLTKALAGSEGHDVNYVSRIRTQYLLAQHQALLTQVQFADAKAIALLTVIGFVVFRGPVPLTREVAADPILAGFFLVGFSALALCLLTVVPRFPPARIRTAMVHRDRWSWPSLAADDLTDADFAEYMQTAEISHLVQSVALSNAAVSRILLAKYTMLRLAFVAAGTALVLLVVAVILAD